MSIDVLTREQPSAQVLPSEQHSVDHVVDDA